MNYLGSKGHAALEQQYKIIKILCFLFVPTSCNVDKCDFALKLLNLGTASVWLSEMPGDLSLLISLYAKLATSESL